MIKIHPEVEVQVRFLDHLREKQLPYATMIALNDTLFDARREVVPLFGRTFPEGKNKTFANSAFRVEKAKKSSLYGSLYDSMERDFLIMQEEGGTKTPDGRALAIPRRGKGKIRRTASGVPKRFRPKNLAQLPDYFSGKPKGHPGAPAGIWKRLPKTRRTDGGLLLMYLFTRRAVVTKSFNGYDQAGRVAVTRFPDHMARAMDRALRTARR